MRKTVAIFALTLASAVFAADADAFNDGVDRSDPNFVKASLVVASPGGELFSCVGHNAIRLECEKFDLDYCFSYESESAKDRLAAYFAGHLKMGMFAVPTADYLKPYADEGRGVRQYPMNLSPSVKQRLWKLLDEKVAEGSELPYDYEKRGCSKSTWEVLRAAIGDSPLDLSAWRPLKTTQRERVSETIASTHPWTLFALHAIGGTGVDHVEQVVVPPDLLAIIRAARIGGVPIIDSEGTDLLPVARKDIASVMTPWIAAWVLLLCGVAFFCKVGFLRKPITAVVLFVQAVFGAFLTFLVLCSSLPATTWNWLIVPFNLLPLIFWKWRRRWALAFAGVLTVWEAGMLLSPHQLTDPAYLVIVLAYIVFYLKIALQGKCLRSAPKTADREEGGRV